MKKCVSLLAVVLILLTGCSTRKAERYTATFLSVFDTVTTVTGYAQNQADFAATAQALEGELLEYHRLFDIYNDYEGLNNLKTVNDNAGIAPVTVDSRILELLEDCKEYYALTGGRVNVALGSVLELWHTAREEGINDPEHARLPEETALKEAAMHCDLNNVVLGREDSTVYLADPDMRLDVGAVAKGWATERVAETAPEGLLLSVGGNVCATGAKDEEGTPWVVGVQDPDGGDAYLHTLAITQGSVVTSGDYQRAYTVDGKLYHHIIDPDTLYPGEYWRGVTILCRDSGLADALSTALFLLPMEQGQALLEKTGAEALWVDAQGQVFCSPGLEEWGIT